MKAVRTNCHWPFKRIHRSFIVNINHIHSIEDTNLIISDGKIIPIGKSYRTNCKDIKLISK